MEGREDWASATKCSAHHTPISPTPCTDTPISPAPTPARKLRSRPNNTTRNHTAPHITTHPHAAPTVSATPRNTVGGPREGGVCTVRTRCAPDRDVVVLVPARWARPVKLEEHISAPRMLGTPRGALLNTRDRAAHAARGTRDATRGINVEAHGATSTHTVSKNSWRKGRASTAKLVAAVCHACAHVGTAVEGERLSLLLLVLLLQVKANKHQGTRQTEHRSVGRRRRRRR